MYLLVLQVYLATLHVRLANEAITRSHDISLVDNIFEAHTKRRRTQASTI